MKNELINVLEERHWDKASSFDNYCSDLHLMETFSSSEQYGAVQAEKLIDGISSSFDWVLSEWKINARKVDEKGLASRSWR